jgi:dolichol kinase
MADAGLAALWVAMLGAGVLAAAGLRLWGLARTHVRDVLHVGAGVWPLGWPFWHGRTAPLAIVWGALLAMAALPALAKHSLLLARLRDGVSSEEEKWSGLVLYTLAAAVLTTVGLWRAPFPAAAALLALALGDGLGGALGLALGRHHFRAPGGKTKSLEGSLAVALFSALGVALAAAWFSAPAAWGVCVLAGLVAAVAEALSPRATDNLVLPASVFGLLALAPGSMGGVL